ncbi:MAG: arginine--tRNA ligase [Patescibacteria group bacterium]
MLNLKKAIAGDVAEGVKAAYLDLKWEVPVVVKLTDNAEHGDYASPVALQLAKLVQGKPLEIVEEIVKRMPKKEYIGRVTAAPPGFLNVHISPGWMTARLDDVVEQDISADFTEGKGKSVNLEFVSANPTGPMTMGNARAGFAADTLANVFKSLGYNVTREYFVNDAGEQVRKLGESVLRRILQLRGEEVEFPEELYQGDYVKDLAQSIAERYKENEGKEFTKEDLTNKELIKKISQEAVALEQAKNEETVREVMKISFDVFTSDRKLREEGFMDKTLKRLTEWGETYEKDGAVWLKTTKYGDDQDRVLVKKSGDYAYSMADIAYHQDKVDRGHDIIFTFYGADHLGHVSTLAFALKSLSTKAEFNFPIAQFFRLIKGGQPVRLSKRRGEVATPKDLIDEVGYDAARFFFLMHDLKSHMDFDLDLAKERSEKNPVYYVQYAYVRLQSILRKAKQEGVIQEIGEVVELTSEADLTHTAELALMREMYRLPEVIVDIAENFAVHQLTYYATGLASAVHFFYKHVPVLAADDAELTKHRLQLVLAARKVLGQTLDLLGISKPDVM